MELKGREIALSGTFAKLGPGEAERRLEAAGARVTDELTPSTAAIFVGQEESRDKGNRAYALGIQRYDEAALLGALAAAEEEGSPSSPEPDAFTDLAALAVADPDELEVLLKDADWASFVPARDLPPLRDRLTALERDHGVTPAHVLAGNRIVVRGTTLSRPDGHRSKITAFALSPSGSHLATADRGEGESGTVQVWEVATGRCVNVMRWIDGGVGWPDEADNLQWSADGQHLGMAFRTNAIGVWDPFGKSGDPRAEAQVTDGHSHPPTWALHPDGKSAFVSIGTSLPGVQGCLPPLHHGVLYWRAEGVEVPHEHILAKGPLPAELPCGDELDIDRAPVWSSDGNLLYAANRSEAFVIDVPSGMPLWLVRGTSLAAWSPDRRHLAHVRKNELHFLDANTGNPACDPQAIRGRDSQMSLHWGMRDSTARLAVVLDGQADTPGVDIFDEGRPTHRLDVTPARTPSDEDFAAWAWAPSGDRAALLTASRDIEIWALADDEPRLLRTLPAPPGAKGVLWGADDVVVAVADKAVRFLRADTGETIGDFTFQSEANAELPLHPEVVYDHFDGRIFALDKRTWCLPVEPNAAIAPPDRRADIEAKLAWIVDRRFAWPLRWGRFHIYADVRSADGNLPMTSPDVWEIRQAAREAAE